MSEVYLSSTINELRLPINRDEFIDNFIENSIIALKCDIPLAVDFTVLNISYRLVSTKEATWVFCEDVNGEIEITESIKISKYLLIKEVVEKIENKESLYTNVNVIKLKKMLKI